MATFAELLTPRNIAIPEGLIADAEVPVLCRPQRQGDVAIMPRPKLGEAEREAAASPIPADGIAVVRGETSTGGNAHILHAEGPCTWLPHDADFPGDVTLGVLEVHEGATAWLIHTEEHGCNGIGPGTYRLTGKRTQVGELQRVTD